MCEGHVNEKKLVGRAVLFSFGSKETKVIFSHVIFCTLQTYFEKKGENKKNVMKDPLVRLAAYSFKQTVLTMTPVTW